MRQHVVALAWIGLLLALVMGACATGRPADSRGGTSAITREEIEEAGLDAGNTFDLVQRLRPNWLQSRTPRSLSGSPPPVLVYIDDRRLGGIDELRFIQAGDIVEIQLLDAAQAQHLPGLGPGHVDSVIMIVTS